MGDGGIPEGHFRRKFGVSGIDIPEIVAADLCAYPFTVRVLVYGGFRRLKSLAQITERDPFGGTIGVFACLLYTSRYHTALKAYFEARRDELCGTCQDRLDRNPMRDVYKRQLLIGEVEEVSPSSDGLSYYAVVRPFVDVRSVTSVFVITSFTGQGADAGSGG